VSTVAKFLDLVPTARWRQPPSVWNEALRVALSDGLIRVGFGGILMLTEKGRKVRAAKIGVAK